MRRTPTGSHPANAGKPCAPHPVLVPFVISFNAATPSEYRSGLMNPSGGLPLARSASLTMPCRHVTSRPPLGGIEKYLPFRGGGVGAMGRGGSQERVSEEDMTRSRTSMP